MSTLSGAPASAPVLAGEMMPRFELIDLADHWNNRAISTADDTEAGRFNVWGNSFPAEHLPPPGTRLNAAGVPFVLADTYVTGDNMRCAGQFVRVPRGRYDWIHLLVASERRTEDTIALHFARSAVDFEALRVSDFWAEAQAYFGERQAFQTPVMHYPHHVQQRVPALMWTQRVPVTRRELLVGLRFPRNIAIHVFALTLQTAGIGEDA